MLPGKGFNQIAVGERFESSMTVTETHLVLGAGLIGDFNPLHVDQKFAEASRFGGRILHGVITSAIMGGPMGMVFCGTAIAYLEHNCRFRAPARAGDTLTTVWTVSEKLPKPEHDGGVAVMQAVCHNQDGTLVAEATGKMLLRNA
ncbi:MAG TPA: MaoC family dehydratase [Burkholderiales bacterium]|nr:MaoC family dehydratase [Burkholderiales bacterium]